LAFIQQERYGRWERERQVGGNVMTPAGRPTDGPAVHSVNIKPLARRLRLFVVVVVVRRTWPCSTLFTFSCRLHPRHPLSLSRTRSLPFPHGCDRSSSHSFTLSVCVYWTSGCAQLVTSSSSSVVWKTTRYTRWRCVDDQVPARVCVCVVACIHCRIVVRSWSAG